MSWMPPVKEKLGPARARYMQRQGKPVTLKQVQLLNNPNLGATNKREGMRSRVLGSMAERLKPDGGL